MLDDLDDRPEPTRREEITRTLAVISDVYLYGSLYLFAFAAVTIGWILVIRQLFKEVQWLFGS